MTLDTRIDSLRAKHAQLEAAIQTETHRPMPDNTLISDLKRQKLKIKEELEKMHS